ncbi:hypothetical protein B0H15DRAFT_412483 [Mycena belliarum]|uniref:Secreted protein n=1 Tax=Mycena belliarum TaxID=1033014 RepID=A0AAD6XT94_9AGAR|nr:hypothetical protein B0H15DRAFT_412483 [Mycena belliae]
MMVLLLVLLFSALASESAVCSPSVTHLSHRPEVRVCGKPSLQTQGKPKANQLPTQRSLHRAPSSGLRKININAPLPPQDSPMGRQRRPWT